MPEKPETKFPQLYINYRLAAKLKSLKNDFIWATGKALNLQQFIELVLNEWTKNHPITKK